MATDMTKGNISRHLIRFAVPLVLSNIFQLTYNAADSIIVGRFVGKDALAAVGTASPIMNIVIFFINGICLGASVLMSEYFGAGDIKKLRKEVSTTLVAGFIFTVTMIILCVTFTRPILSLIRTPEEIMGQTSLYLRVIFLSLIFTFLYNIYASALRSIGDSKNPLIFLAVSAVLNVIMDIIFVVFLKMGVLGSAMATGTAEMMSAIFCIIYVYKRIPILQFSLREMKLDRSLLKITVNYSWVTAMQQTCLYVGKFLIQGVVNALGVDTIAAFNAVNKVDDFAFAPQQNISNAMTTFIAQNRGAKKNERIKKGFSEGMKIEMAYWVMLALVVYFGAPYIIRLFVKGSELKVITLGINYLCLMAVFYVMPGWTNGIQGYFRGVGNMKITLRSTFMQMLGRVSLAYILAPRIGMVGIALSCFGGWIVMLAYEIPFFIKDMRTN